MVELIKIQKISKSYGQTKALDQISLVINQGEIFGILGPNGAGKTTLIRILVKLLKPDSGEIVLNIPQNKRRFQEYFGICPQELVFWSKLTCIEQLMFAGRMYKVPENTCRDRSEEILRKIHLDEKRNALASTLSGGMKRRLNLGLGLVHDPPILILDEPEAGLDPQSRILVREYIQELAEHKTIIFSTHNMDEADRLGDRIAIIDHGRILAVDTPEGLKASIGKGDVLELSVRVGSTERVRGVLDTLEGKLEVAASQAGESIILRGKNLVPEIPGIMELFEANSLGILEMKLRENTLEDVFIELTGRGLRE